MTPNPIRNRMCRAVRTALAAALVAAGFVAFASAPAQAAGQIVDNAYCKSSESNIRNGYCVAFNTSSGRRITWLGSFNDSDGDPFICIDYMYSARLRINQRVTLENGLVNQHGLNISGPVRKALSYAVSAYAPNGTSGNDVTDAALGLIAREVMQDGYRDDINLQVFPKINSVDDPVFDTSWGVPGNILSRAREIWNDARNHYGPYDATVTGLPTKVITGKWYDATTRVTSQATGKPLADAKVVVSVTNGDIASDGTKTITRRTDNSGRVSYRVRGIGVTNPLRVTAEAQDLPGVWARLGTPSGWSTNPGGSSSSSVPQRGLIATESSARAATTASVNVAPAPPVVATTTSHTTTGPGTAVSDQVQIGGTGAGYTGTGTAVLYGPFANDPGPTDCAGAPVAGTVTFPITGDGVYNTPTITLTDPGFYTWRITVPASGTTEALTTPCGIASETTEITPAPHVEVETLTSDASTVVGASLTDRVTVTTFGVADPNVDYVGTVTATLYGPFATFPQNNDCIGAPEAGSVTFETTDSVFVDNGDGTWTAEYTTLPVTVTAPGYYTWVESMPDAGGVAASETPCGAVSETSWVAAQPAFVTQVNDQSVDSGAEIFDIVTVSGMDPLPGQTDVPALDINWALYGPYLDDPASTDCIDTPVASGIITATGNGDYTTTPVTVTEPGYYTYVEFSDPLATTFADGLNIYEAAQTECGIAEETSIVRGVPEVDTLIGADGTEPAPEGKVLSVPVGTPVFDTVTLDGLFGGDVVTVNGTLYGPFDKMPTPDQCTKDKAYGKTTFNAGGNGTYTTDSVTVEDSGFYTWEQKVLGGPTNASYLHQCGFLTESVRAIFTPPTTPEDPETPETPEQPEPPEFGGSSAGRDSGQSDAPALLGIVALSMAAVVGGSALVRRRRVQ